MGIFRGFLAAIQRHKVCGWLGLLVYACAVSFPHQFVQDVVGKWAAQHTLKRLYQVSVSLHLSAAAIAIVFFALALPGMKDRISRIWVVGYWILSFALMVGTWKMFMANNTELVHYPQYFPEGMALAALTSSPAECLAWVAFLGGIDEAMQYTYLVGGRPLPYDFNDIYMDVLGGATGMIFGLAVLGFVKRTEVRGWLRRVFTRPGIVLILGILVATLVLLATGKAVLYAPPGDSHWIILSRLKTDGFWYFSPVILGPHHFHEMTSVEGTVLILLTIAVYSVLDRRVEAPPGKPAAAPREAAWTAK